MKMLSPALITLSLLTLSACATGPTVYQSVRAEQASLCEGKKPNECEAQVMKVFVARLAHTYPRANFVKVQTRCAAYPADCTPETLEEWVSDSHWASVMGAMGDSLQGYSRSLSSPSTPTIRCVSQPNVMGGYNTSCK